VNSECFVHGRKFSYRAARESVTLGMMLNLVGLHLTMRNRSFLC
jgi:hypothetical protein